MSLRSALLACTILPAMAAATSADDSQVLSTVAAVICGASSSSKYVLLDTSGDIDNSSEELEGAGAAPEVAQVLMDRNKQRSQLPSDVDYMCLGLTNAKHVDSLFSANSHRDGWKEFRKHFRGATGIIRLTLPGYSTSGLDAALIVSASCDWLCGSGELYLLHRTGNVWAVTKRVELWIS